MVNTMSNQSNTEVDRHEIDCVCGHTSVGDSRLQAEENHLRHFLSDHENLKEWERNTAENQLQHAVKNRKDI